MSFVQFLRIFWVRRWIIVAATLSVFVSAAATGTLLPTRYTATSRLMLKNANPGQVQNSKAAGAFLQTQAELIRDYRVAGRVVDDLGWTSSPQLLGQYNARDPNDGRDFRRWAAQFIIDGTRVSAAGDGGILDISYSANNPEAARVIADAVRKAYVDETLAFERENATDNADWYDEQIVKLRSALSVAEAQKADFERENDIVLYRDDMDLESARLLVLAGVGESAGSAKAQLAAQSNVPLDQMDAQIASAEQTMGPNNPVLQDLRRQRDALARSTAAERALAPSAAPGARALAGAVKAQAARVLGQREKVNQARRYQANILVLRDQYNRTVAKAADARQRADTDDAGLVMLGNAAPPTEPVFPNWPFILLGSLGLGLILGMLVALITELLSSHVRGTEDLSRAGVPMLGVLPGFGDGRRAAAKG